MLEKMQVLIVGGTGVISGCVAPYFVQQGAEVFLLNRGNSKKYENIVTQLCADMQNETAVEEVLRGRHFDAIVDFIAFSGDQMRQHLRLLAPHCKQFIFISSCCVFKGKEGEALTEESRLHTEAHWDYVLGKLDGETTVRDYFKTQSGSFYTIVRPHHSYDDRSFPAFIPGPTQSLLTRIQYDKPTIMWDRAEGSKVNLTHGCDFAQGLYGLIGNTNAFNEDFNIVNDEVLTWKQALLSIYEVCGKEAHIAEFDAECLEKNLFRIQGTITDDKGYDHIFNINKLRSAVPSYNPQISFADGVRRVVANVLPELPAIVPLIDGAIDELLRAENFAGKTLLSKDAFSCIRKVPGLPLQTKLQMWKRQWVKS